jgi:histidinol-phosphate aminotransferase
MAFGEQGVKHPAISYGFYPVFAQLHGLVERKIPLRLDFSIDPSDYAGNDALVVIANPNAPTGRELSQVQIQEILEANPDQVVVIDEAYVDFGAVSTVPLTKQYQNLLVVQTFSKSRSLAGARLGFAIASETLINDLETIKYSTNPYNVNTVSAAAGAAALSEEEYYQENCRRIMDTRQRAVHRFKALGFHVVPSVANFLFVTTDRIRGKDLYEKLKEKHILIRHFDNPVISEYNRITIGTDEEMEILFDAIGNLLGKENI